MRHFLTSVRTVVDHGSETRMSKTFLMGNDPSRDQKVAEDVAVLDLGLGNSCNGLARDEQKMNRGLWVDIPQTQTVLILVNDVCGYFPVSNVTREGVHCGIE